MEVQFIVALIMGSLKLHVGSQEERYHFIDVETLVADFLAEIEKARRKEI